MKIAVIVTTYNRPDALAAVLVAYLAQNDRGFEIVVADDGSGPETAAIVEAYRGRTEIAIAHIRQEDRGFRAGAVRNRALAVTDADYVVFTDGDCLPLPGFVAGHRRLARQGWFVAGNRVLMAERLSRRILVEHLPVHAWSMGRWFQAFLKGELNRLFPLLPLPVPGWLRELPARRWQGVMTCNLAVWRDDLLAVNGFDERYQGWGLEDSDLTIRLLHAGLRRRSARFAAPLLHLWHPQNDRTTLAENRRRLDVLLSSNDIRAGQGVDRYL
ncbi:MAG: glycosyltransferase [Deltaproteobacteria bacterium]|nr:glycosyltransferase [Deltaproteobacteria bacterium]